MEKIIIAIGNLNIGGGQSVVCKLAENIDKEKYHVVVVCLGPKRNTSIEEKVEAVAEVHYLDIKTGFTIRSYLLFAKAMRHLSPSIIHAHLGAVHYTAIWSIIHRKRIVVTAHTTPEKAFSKNCEKIVRYGLKRRLITLVAVSKDNEKRCQKYFGLDNSCCKCVNNGVDIYGIDSQKQEKRFTFINVATQNDNKNQHLLIECMETIVKFNGNSRLLLVGDGPEHDKLIKYVKDCGLEGKVEFVGEVSDPTPYYAVSDIYLQSSHREAMPMSILEALGHGLPIISTDVGGIKDVIQGNGFLVKDNDKQAYETAMISMISMSDEVLGRLREKSLEIVKNYSSKKMALEYEKIYESLL